MGFIRRVLWKQPVLMMVMAGLLCLAGCPVKEARTQFIPDEELAAGEFSVRYDQGFVIYLSGEVTVTDAAGERPVQVGDIVLKGRTIATGKDSFCELQFGDVSVIHIDESSSVMTDMILFQPQKTDIQLNVTLGTLLCKVEKLSGEERFSVRTRTAVCGVRGTEFGVSVRDDQSTVLAVQTGLVTILPSAAGIGELERKAQAFDPEFAAELKDIISSAPVVGENEETVVSAETAFAMDARVRKIDVELERLSGKGTITAEERKTFRETLKETRDEIRVRVKLKREIDPVRKDKLRRLKDLENRRIPDLPLRESDSERRRPTNAASARVRIRVTVEPKEASIILDNRYLGKGRFQGLFKTGTELSFSFFLPGFTQETRVIRVNPESERRIEIRLKEAGSGEGDEPEAGGTDENTGITRDGEIGTVDGADEDAGGAREAADLSKGRPIVQIAKPSDAAFTGNLFVSGSNVIGGNADGRVFACTTRGRLLWRYRPASPPDPRTGLVVDSERVYLTTLSELIVLDARNGKIQQRIRFADRDSTPGVRGTMAAGGLVVFGDGEKVKVYQAKTLQPVGEFEVPGRLAAPPVFYNSQLYVPDVTGAVWIIDMKAGRMNPDPLATGLRGASGLQPALGGSRCYFLGGNNILVGIDLATGRSWERELPAADSPVRDLGVNERGVFVTTGETLLAFSHDNRALFDPVRILSAPPLAVSGRLIAGTTANALAIIDARTGETIKQLSVPARITARPATLGRLIVVGTADGRLVFIDPENF